MNNIRRLILRPQRFIRCYSNDIYEPDYLDALKPKVPIYDALNVQMRGHDYCVLENYQSLIHNLARNMEIDVEDSWAIPVQDMQVTTYKPNSDIVASQYKLKVYERVVQIVDVSTLQLPILLRAIEASAPSGVSVELVKHEESQDEIRYVPDQELLTLKQELDDIGGPRKTK